MAGAVGDVHAEVKFDKELLKTVQSAPTAQNNRDPVLSREQSGQSVFHRRHMLRRHILGITATNLKALIPFGLLFD